MEGLVDNVGAYTLSMARECRNLAILALFFPKFQCLLANLITYQCLLANLITMSVGKFNVCWQI